MPPDQVCLPIATGDSSALIVSFAEIEEITRALQRNNAGVEQQRSELGAISSRAALLESLPLSPLTGIVAVGALAGAAVRLEVHLALGNGLLLVAVTVVSTYELADRAIAESLAVLESVGHEMRVVAALGDILGIGIILLDGVAWSAALGFRDEAARVFCETFLRSLQRLQKNPRLFLQGSAGMISQLDDDIEEFSIENAINNTLNHGEEFLGSLGPVYDVMIAHLIADLDAFGATDGGVLLAGVSAGESKNQRARAKDFNERYLLDTDEVDDNLNIIPTDIRGLMLSMGQINAIGAESEGVIRVVTTGTPPSFTLIIPPTGQWWPTARTQPNDLLGNFSIMLGHSQLERLSDEALGRAIGAYNAAHPGSTVTAQSAAVMVAGFSQGGITAAAFARDFSGKYNITQVVTIGAPLGRTLVPTSVLVTAYESVSDPVPRVDGAKNPDLSHYQTIYGDNGGGVGGSHDPARYAVMSQGGEQPRTAAALDQFFSSDSTVTDYYAQK